MPNRLTKTKVDALYTAIGKFVVAWATMEVCIDTSMLLTHSPKPKLAHQLSEKTKLVRQRLIPQLSEPLARETLRLVDEIDALADTRYDYVHGAIIGHTFKRSNLTVTLGRLLKPPKNAARPSAKVTALQISRTADRLLEIYGQMLDLAGNIIEDHQ